MSKYIWLDILGLGYIPIPIRKMYRTAYIYIDRQTDRQILTINKVWVKCPGTTDEK